MTAKELFREIGGISDVYVEEAERAKRSLAGSPYVRRTLAAAACLCLCLGSFYAVRLMDDRSADSSGAPQSAASVQEEAPADAAAIQKAALDLEMSDEAAGADEFSDSAQKNFLAEGEQEANPADLRGEAAPAGGGSDQEGQLPAAAAEQEKETSRDMEEYGDALSPGETPAGGQSAAEASGEGSSDAEPFDAQEPLREISGEEPTDAQKPMMEIPGADVQQGQSGEGISQGAAGGDPGRESADRAPTEICGLPPVDPGEEVTLEQARESQVFGAYVPAAGPEGYVFSAGSLRENENRLSLSWTRGLDYLEYRYSLYDAGQENRLADPERPEDYDMSCYSIPLSEAVPEEKIPIVDCPIFRVQDLTEAILEARAYFVPEAGDTSGPRIRLGILYEDGVLLEITSKGVTPEGLGSLLGLE